MLPLAETVYKPSLSNSKHAANIYYFFYIRNFCYPCGKKRFAGFKKLAYLCSRFKKNNCRNGSSRIFLFYTMSKNLVIVESPTKAKTIERILGKDNYHVLSSQGHVRDIEGEGKNSIGIDFANHYTPHYAIEPEKKKLIDTLQREAKAAECVWLASDEDREGEAIAWHLKEVLHLSDTGTKRIVFHEITPDAIKNAISNPRDIDYNLVNAQQARRVMDRIVGFELSPVLWKKILPGLSAGRVQSVAVRLVVEKEKEIEAHKTSSQYRVIAELLTTDVNGKEVSLTTELNHRFATREQAKSFLEELKSKQLLVEDITCKPAKRSPAPPFTTSLLQQEAARKLHFPVSKTMRLAQSLYEAGHITYMRTDSVNLSTLALATARKAIIAEYGESYHKGRQYKTTSKGAQEAHEAIRPAYIEKTVAGANEDERRLYTLIRQRTLASQMADAELERTTIQISISDSEYKFCANGEVVSFDGFMRAYVQSSDDDDENTNTLLPKLNISQPVTYLQITAQQSFTKAPVRYTEGSLVKKMEELGIGRPSTYASIIDTIISRKYVQKVNLTGSKRNIDQLILKAGKITEKNTQETFGAESQKLTPTDIGMATNAFLVEQFPDILNYDFTAHSEESFDDIAEGKKIWYEVVDHFYKTFHPSISAVEKIGKVEGRELGKDPKSGKPVIAKIGKRGPCIQIGTVNDEEKPRFASLLKGQSIFTITLQEALSLFDTPFPYTVGEFEGQQLVVGEGMYGPYVKQDKTYYSIPKDMDAARLTLEDAIAIIEKKRQTQLPIHVFGDIQVLNGRFGPYIKQGDNNYRLPKGTDAERLTEEECKRIISETQPTGSKKTSRSSTKKK